MMFSASERKEIEATVSEAEKQTSGEIVVMTALESHDYWWVHWAWAVLGAVISSSIALWGNYWSMEIHDFVLLQGISLAAGFVLPYWPSIKRFTLPRAWMESQVHAQCCSQFIQAGLTETRDRTGVLIYISELERRVEILADRGIDSRVEVDFWEKEVSMIVEGIRNGKPTDGLQAAIRGIASKLIENFPVRADDQNELPNQVRGPKGR